MQPASINLATPTLSRTNSGPSSGRSGSTMRRAFNPANSNSMAAQGQGEFGCCITTAIVVMLKLMGVACLGCLGFLGYKGYQFTRK